MKPPPTGFEGEAATDAGHDTPVTTTGRRYMPPTDRPSADALSGDRRVRSAWLLGQTRSHRTSFSTRRQFLAALNDLGVRTDEPRLSRWESGQLAVPHAAILAYETLAGL
ncbi:MAG: hypothetical protein QM655_14895, partial [Nocardioidaceae bacterium]